MSSPAPASRRTRVVALVVVVAMVALSAATLLGILLSGDSGTARPSSTGAEPDPGLTLVLPAPPAGRCAALSVEVLRGAEQAFAGTVLTADDREVVLRVDHRYRGSDAALVRLTVGDLASRGLVAGVGFAEGQQYLVSATRGVVTPCGYSAPWSPSLARAYAEAFGG